MINLDEIREKWLQQCAACDAGLPMACSHPCEDYRPVILELVREVERLRAPVPPGVEPPRLGRSACPYYSASALNPPTHAALVEHVNRCPAWHQDGAEALRGALHSAIPPEMPAGQNVRLS